jgi:hypothetical protein
MPPPKKAPQKTTQKAAKKSARHHHGNYHQARDLRRAYEHMGRLEVLAKNLKPSAFGAVSSLTVLAQSEMAEGHNESAAELMRASEHLSFASLAGDGQAGGLIPTELKRSITEHFDELLRKADHHWEDHAAESSILTLLYKSSRRSAVKAFEESAYYQALEFARAAEALSHVREGAKRKLESHDRKPQLKIAG